jgi:hypothetical protein
LFVRLLLLLFVVLSIQYSVKVLQHRGAITRWREQLLSWQEGEDIYARFVYPNPPIMALLLLPLAQLPPLAGALVWFYLKAGMTLLVLCWVLRLVEAQGRPFPFWAKALAVALSLRPIMGDLYHGNINLFILFLVAGGIYAFHCRRDFLAGGAFALATACKVTPALFLPYLVWKRAWGGVAGFAVGMALFFWPGFVPACYLGWEKNQEHLGSWVKQMVEPYLVHGVVTSEHNNQSLPGLAYRLLTPSPSFTTYDADGNPASHLYHNLAALPAEYVRWMVKGCLFLFALGVMVTCRTPRPRPGLPDDAESGVPVSTRLAAESSVIVLGMLLFSERTWKHHCVTLILPFTVLCYYIAACRPTALTRRSISALLVVAFVLMAATSTSIGTDSLSAAANSSVPGSAKLAQVYGAYVWVFLLLLGAMFRVLAGGARAKVAAQPLPLPTGSHNRLPLAG